MKCPNCGFDVNTKYCSMCGTKMSEQENYQQPADTGDNNNQNFQNNIPNIPLNNNTSSYSAPAVNGTQMPGYTQNESTVGAKLPMSKAKITGIIVGAILGFIILFGILSSLICYIFNNRSLIDTISDAKKQKSSSDTLPYNYEEENKFNDENYEYSIIEPGKYFFTSKSVLKFKEIKVTDEKDDNNESITKYSLVFNIKNNSNETIDYLFYGYLEFDNGSGPSTIIADAKDNENIDDTSLEISINAGENKDIYLNFNMDEEIEKTEFLFGFSENNMENFSALKYNYSK